MPVRGWPDVSTLLVWRTFSDVWLLEASVVFSLILAAMYLSDLNVPLLQTGPRQCDHNNPGLLVGFDLEKCQIVQQNLNYLPPSPASLRIARNCLIMFSVAKGLSALNSDSR